MTTPLLVLALMVIDDNYLHINHWTGSNYSGRDDKLQVLKGKIFAPELIKLTTEEDIIVTQQKYLKNTKSGQNTCIITL